MTLFEAISMNKEVMNRLREYGAKPDDWQYVDLYSDYQRMRMGGDKVTYIVSVLAERYRVSERKVYSLIKRLGSHCTVCAV